MIVAIAGGSGSGKTTVATALADRLNDATVLPLDRFYKPLRHLSLEEREGQNFDHPDALDWDEITRTVQELETERTADIPVYSFEESTRTGYERLEAGSHLILEGLYTLHHADIRQRADLRVFLDVPADIRLLRRTKRDVQERGSSLSFALNQYAQYTRPMHQEYVEPTKEHADIVLEDSTDEAVERVLAAIRERKGG